MQRGICITNISNRHTVCYFFSMFQPRNIEHIMVNALRNVDVPDIISVVEFNYISCNEFQYCKDDPSSHVTHKEIKVIGLHVLHLLKI